MTIKSASAFAPASVANVAVGFDIMGFALPSLGDVAHVKTFLKKDVNLKEDESSMPVRLLEIKGLSGLPLDPQKNTATAGLLELQKDHAPDWHFEVSIDKGIPMCSGLGGSAASAVAALTAANSLLDKPLPLTELLYYATVGESVASGSFHADNVAPSLFGGLILLGPAAIQNAGIKNSSTCVIPLKTPQGLHTVVAYPQGLSVSTQEARAKLRHMLSLKEHIAHNSRLATFILGCERSQWDWIRASFEDTIIEPQRQELIAGFSAMKSLCLSLGALGASISGSGPTLFAWAKNAETAQQIANALTQQWPKASEGRVEKVLTWISPIENKGSYIL